MNAKILVLERQKEKLWEKISHNLLLHRRSGFYYVRKKRKGKTPLFQTTGLKTKKAAQTKADQMIVDWLGGKPSNEDEKPDAAGMTVGDLVDDFLEVLEQEFKNGDRRKRTFDHDKTYAPILKVHFGNILITDIDEAFWENWVRTIGRKLDRDLFDLSKYLSKLLTFAHRKKCIDRKPMIRNPDREKKSGLVYENADIEQFIRHADPMLRDMIIIGAECGLRPHENRNLKWDWISFETECVTIQIPGEFAKTGSGRRLRVSVNSQACLRRRFEKKVGPFVFPAPSDPYKAISDCQLSRLWRAMLKRAGMRKGLKFHWLRHSFFTKALLDAKLPLAEVAQYGGNSPTILMKKYLQDDPSRTASVATAVQLKVDKTDF